MAGDPPLLSDVRYEDLAGGQRWGPFAETIDARTADAVRGPVGEPVPGERAPLGVLPLVTLRVLRRALDGIPPGGVLVRHHFAVLGALLPGRPLAVEVWVSAQQRRPSGLSTTLTFSLAQDGVLVATVDWMILAPPAPAAEGER